MSKPCIRGLREFKKGCPENNSCSAWITDQIVNKKGDKEIISQCLDLWMFTLGWSQCALLEGNQQATESFRNGMVEIDPENPSKSRPKAMALTIQKIATQRHVLETEKTPMIESL